MTNKVKQVLKTIIGLLAIHYAQATYATECDVPAAHISGVVTIHISKFGMNYPINRGDFQLTSPDDIKIDCERKALGGIKFTGSKSLSKTVDVQGSDAWGLPQQEQGTPRLGIAPSMYMASGMRESIYADTAISNINSAGSTFYTVDIVSLTDVMSIPETGSSVTYVPGDAIAYASFQVENNYSVEHPALYLDSLTINYVVSSCGIKSKQGSVVNWTGLYKGNITSGSVVSKPYSLFLICGNESDPPTPVNITFSSTHGFAVAAKDVVKTNLTNVGLKLSWANPSLPPLVLDQVNHSTLSGVGDYSVMAKPVKIVNSAEMLVGGTFDTTVTMNIEFE